MSPCATFDIIFFYIYFTCVVLQQEYIQTQMLTNLVRYTTDYIYFCFI